MTKKLANIQDKFVESLYDEKDREVLQFIKSDNIPKEELIDIYRDGINANLINALRITYPRVDYFLKEKKFDAVCREFITQNRSKSGNLDEYGSEFSDFLLQKNEEFLSDVAKLEWAQHDAYLVPDLGPFDLGALQKLSPEKLCDVKFDLHPSVFLMTSSYSIFVKRKQVKPSKRQNYYITYRNNLDVECYKIPKSEFNFLAGVRNDLTFYEICEKYQVDAQLCLQKYISSNVLGGFEI